MISLPVKQSDFSDNLFLAGFYIRHRDSLENFEISPRKGIQNEMIKKNVLSTYEKFKKVFAETTIQSVQNFFGVNLVILQRYSKCTEMGYKFTFENIPDEWNAPGVLRHYTGKLKLITCNT